MDNTLKPLGDLLQPNGIVRNDKLGIPHSDKNGWLAQLMEALTASNAFAIQQVSWLNAGVDAQGENSAQRLNSALAAVHAAAAKDEVEAMLAKQMAAAHVATMKCPFQLQHSRQNPQLEAHGNMANTRLRTFAVQLVALAKLRRSGEQTVRVEHVHVHAGGRQHPVGPCGGWGPGSKTAKIADELAAGGYRNDRGAIYSAKSVRAVLAQRRGSRLPDTD